MKDSLIVVRKNTLVVSTWMIAHRMGIQHKSVKNLMKLHKIIPIDEIIEAVDCPNSCTKKKAGRAVQEYFLMEDDAIRLILRMKNIEEVLTFKDCLVKEFSRQRRLIDTLIVQRQNTEWLEKRASGKIERRLETDAIKEFIEYAISQGSKNAVKYYIIITKMQNSALFNMDMLTIECPNIRDVVDGLSLDALKMCDVIVAKTIRDKMKDKMFYKDIFQCAKARVESFADSIGRRDIGSENMKRIS